MEDPVTKQVEILAGKDATKMAFVLAMMNQLRQWRWGRILTIVSASKVGAVVASAVMAKIL